MQFKVETLLKSQVSRWLMVASATVLIDTIVFTMIFNELNKVLLSNLVSGSISAIFGYLMHHKFTFRSNESHKHSGTKYFLILFLFWCVNTISVKIIIIISSEPSFSKILVAFVQAPISYFILSHKVFYSSELNSQD